MFIGYNGDGVYCAGEIGCKITAWNRSVSR
jgi:hypothetical protein